LLNLEKSQEEHGCSTNGFILLQRIIWLCMPDIRAKIRKIQVKEGKIYWLFVKMVDQGLRITIL